jgi:hypothetical protein
MVRQRANGHPSGIMTKLPTVEQIDAGDMETHQHFMAHLARAQQDYLDAQRALGIWGARLTEKYGLDAQKDAVDGDGTIQRGARVRDPLLPVVPDAPASHPAPVAAVLPVED